MYTHIWKLSSRSFDTTRVTVILANISQERATQFLKHWTLSTAWVACSSYFINFVQIHRVVLHCRQYQYLLNTLFKTSSLLHHLQYPSEGFRYPQLYYDSVFGNPWAILGNHLGR